MDDCAKHVPTSGPGSSAGPTLLGRGEVKHLAFKGPNLGVIARAVAELLDLADRANLPVSNARREALGRFIRQMGAARRATCRPPAASPVCRFGPGGEYVRDWPPSGQEAGPR